MSESLLEGVFEQFLLFKLLRRALDRREFKTLDEEARVKAVTDCYSFEVIRATAVSVAHIVLQDLHSNIWVTLQLEPFFLYCVSFPI